MSQGQLVSGCFILRKTERPGFPSMDAACVAVSCVLSLCWTFDLQGKFEGPPERFSEPFFEPPKVLRIFSGGWGLRIPFSG